MKKMKNKVIMPAILVVLTLLTMSTLGAAQELPHIDVDKSVSPSEIYTKGDGGMPDTATVILSIIGDGDPIPGEEDYVPTDVVFVVDDTGSMGNDIAQVKTDITYITDTLVAEIPDIRFGLVSYKDSAHRDLALTSNVATFKSKVNALYASGGGDWQEAVKPALQLSYASSWRSDSIAKVVVLIGDAPPHDTSGAIAAAKAAYVDEYGIYTNTIACSGDATTTNAFKGIASAGHGTYAFKGDPKDLADAIIDSIKSVVPTIDTAGKNAVVTEVVPSCIEVSNFNPVYTSFDGVDTYTWDLGTIGIDKTKTVTFDIQCTCAGNDKLVDVYPDTSVTYDAWDGTGFTTPTTKPFPKTTIDCKISAELPELCPDEYRWGSGGWEWDPFPDTFVGRQEVHFVNKGTVDVYNVAATVTCTPINVVATDPDVTLGDIPAGGSAWSSDTFELRVDMTNPQGPDKGICWRVEYDDAAGVHHTIEDIAKYCGERCSAICP